MGRTLLQEVPTVPVYQYHCRDCDKDFERVESMQEHGAKSPACPFCGSRSVEQRMADFFAKTARKS